MDSDQSYSGDSNSSSDSSSGSSDGEEEVLEPVKILSHTLELPQDLCEDYGIFKEFFSMKTWEALDDKQKDHLKGFLPKFTDNEEEEYDKTIRMLFNRETFHFTSPLNDFYSNLRQGNYRPDIAKMKKFLLKARAKQQRHKIKSYYAKLLPEVLISRERLLAASRAAPPGASPFLPALPPKPSSKNKYRSPHVRARQRYFEELAAIRGEVGGDETEDENYPEGPLIQPSRKRGHISSPRGHIGQTAVDGNISGTLGGNDPASLNSMDCLKNVLAAHRARRQYRENHPELNTTGITLDDIRQRVALVNGAKKLMFGGQKSNASSMQKIRRGPKKDNTRQSKTPDAKSKIKEDANLENIENKPLLPNIKIKCEPEETDSESSSFVDPVTSPKRGKLTKSPDVEIKQEVVDIKYPDSTNIKFMDRKLDSVVKQEPQDVISMGSKLIQPVPIKLEDLDGIDMMALPIELADDTGEVVTPQATAVDPDDSLTETTYANFLSLVRALFPARAAHRASKQQLKSRCAAVMRSPIAPLNTWYSLSEDWCAELDSALEFLAGERGQHPDDFVPYLQFIPETQMYQWIGAGRDCDAILGRLCERWVRSTSPQLLNNDVPPPRYPTSWIVRAPTSAELAEFRSQERKRFASAAKPFTYIQHGYRSPVGGCARAGGGASASASASADASSPLVTEERPRHVTLQQLVRDALARLPNGEGTTAHLLTLLKMSQYITTSSDQVLMPALSAILDRLLSAKRDPVIKYDTRTATWTYLHRNRSEEDYIKSPARSRKQRKSTPPPPAPDPQTMDIDVAVEEVVENASDSDVDVDDSTDSTPMPHLSSAQLLRQVTQATQAKQLIQQTTKHTKPKLVPAQKKPTTPRQQSPKKSAPKPATAKAASFKTQSPKQPTPKTSPAPKANLTSPKATKPVNAVKQAAQIAKQTNAAQNKTGVIQSNKPVSSVSQMPAKPQSQSKTHQAVQKLSPQQTKPVPQLVQKSQPQVKSSVPTMVPAKPAPAQMTQTKPVQSTTTTKPVQSTTKPSAPIQAQLPKTSPMQAATTPVTQHRSPLIKQRPLLKQDTSKIETTEMATVAKSETLTNTALVQQTSTVTAQQQQIIQNKLAQCTRSLLLRPTASPTVSESLMPTIQMAASSRRGLVRVLNPATPSAGKSLISPRALLTQGGQPASKKRPQTQNTPTVTTVAQSVVSATTVVSSAPTVVSSALQTRTVQLGGRTVQLAANQTVHLPGGQAVQLSSGHTLQLSSLQLPTHSVRLPSGQTVQLASPQTVRAISTTAVKNTSPKPQQYSPTIVKPQTHVQIPVSSVQLAGQTVQIGGQSVQLTGHTVKLPSGQSVQVASQSVQLPTQSVQLPSGQTVQLASRQSIPTVQLANQSVISSGQAGQSLQLGAQTVQIGGQSVQLAGGQTVQLPSGQTVQFPSGQTVQLPSGQTVQLPSGQTVQMPSGQTVQLPSGQTVQLPSGQTVQLPSGQTIQLSSGQTLQLSGQTVQLAQKVQHVVRSTTSADKPAQPIVAKLLTNAQGQMISLEGVMGGARTLQLAGVRPQGQKTLQTVQSVGGVRVVSAAGARVTRPLILTAAKPLHNIILQQSDGSAIRVTSTGVTPTQTIVLGSIGGQTATTTTTPSPVLKLQQVNALQQVKLAQGIKIQQAGTGANVPTSSGAVRSVLMDGQQLKLVGGRHVLARFLRPNQPPP